MNLVGVGVVFRDEAGSYAGDFIRKLPHATNPRMVELMATQDGILWDVQRHWQHVVQDIGSLKKGSSPTDLLVKDIREGLRVFVESKIHYQRFFYKTVCFLDF
ncbi:hypothetical protein DVH24_042562 [Malus domestica]|uniref:Uncharacterized protein n=1 Tax=Malus domestica TaxID=3750 RepID=A0A498JAQ0_MALDO|nr:hypothetical protein DVH24_042562 [Malus domestica]